MRIVCSLGCRVILMGSFAVEDFEDEHEIPTIGQRNMLLNARRFPPESDDPYLATVTKKA